MMLTGQVDLIEGSRQMCDLRFGLDEANDVAFHQFIMVDEETDRFPLGDVRNQWSLEALRRIDDEKESYLRSVRADILEACDEIVRRFSRIS